MLSRFGEGLVAPYRRHHALPRIRMCLSLTSATEFHHLNAEFHAAARPLSAPRLVFPNRLFAAPARASPENVKKLREQTSLSIGLCQKALETCQNDINAAMAWLERNEQARAE